MTDWLSRPEPVGTTRWAFPPSSAWPDGDLIAIGGDLEPATLITAYRSGIFPMMVETPESVLAWWSPDPHGILPLDKLRVTRSLRQSAKRYDDSRRHLFRRRHSPVRRSVAREGVDHGRVRPARTPTLHQLGWAHSVEVFDRKGQLAGGLYGVRINGLFAGESMFHAQRDASKVALMALVQLMRESGMTLLDVQWQTEHLESLGATEVGRRQYLACSRMHSNGPAKVGTTYITVRVRRVRLQADPGGYRTASPEPIRSASMPSEFIEIIEWLDDTRDTLSHRFPDDDRAIKRGAQLIVRESQAAQFVYLGQYGDTFGPGKHRLTTDNIPILSRIKGWKYGFESPFKADVYFITTRLFTGNQWGTANPIMLRDPDLDVVRVRAFGTYDFRVRDPKRFLRRVAGTDDRFTRRRLFDRDALAHRQRVHRRAGEQQDSGARRGDPLHRAGQGAAAAHQPGAD